MTEWWYYKVIIVTLGTKLFWKWLKVITCGSGGRTLMVTGEVVSRYFCASINFIEKLFSTHYTLCVFWDVKTYVSVSAEISKPTSKSTKSKVLIQLMHNPQRRGYLMNSFSGWRVNLCMNFPWWDSVCYISFPSSGRKWGCFSLSQRRKSQLESLIICGEF